MENPFKKLVEEWKKATPKEKLFIVGAVASVAALAFYLHGKSSSAAGTGNTGLPSTLQPSSVSGGGGGTTGTTGTTTGTTGTDTGSGSGGGFFDNGGSGSGSPIPVYYPPPTTTSTGTLQMANKPAGTGTLQQAANNPLAIVTSGVAASSIVPPAPNPGQITNPNTGGVITPVRLQSSTPTVLANTYANIVHQAPVVAPVASTPAPAQVAKNKAIAQ